jgi:hypothetical protein
MNPHERNAETVLKHFLCSWLDIRILGACGIYDFTPEGILCLLAPSSFPFRLRLGFRLCQLSTAHVPIVIFVAGDNKVV